MPAFRPLLHGSEHPFHAGRGRLRDRRLRGEGGLRRRVDGGPGGSHPRGQRLGARTPGGGRRTGGLAVLRGRADDGGCAATRERRVGDAVFVGHHRQAEGGTPSTAVGRQRILGTGGAGDGADSQIRDEAVRCVSVPRPALPRRRCQLHHGGQSCRGGVDHHGEVRCRERAAADRDPPRHTCTVRADHVRADAETAASGPRQVRRVQSAVRDSRRRPVPGRRQAPDDGLVRAHHPRVLRRDRRIRGHHDRAA